MYPFLSLILILLLNAAMVVNDLSAAPAVKEAPKKPAAVKKILPRAEIYDRMEQTLFSIRDSFKEIKQGFAQLADIDSATIKKDGIKEEGRIRFDYERGVVKESISGEPTFAQDGCDIVVQLKYPATQEDVDMRRLKGSLVPLRNGKSYAVWYLVRAERTEEGNLFKRKANEIISFHLKTMQKSFDEPLR